MSSEVHDNDMPLAVESSELLGVIIKPPYARDGLTHRQKRLYGTHALILWLPVLHEDIRPVKKADRMTNARPAATPYPNHYIETGRAQ